MSYKVRYSFSLLAILSFLATPIWAALPLSFTSVPAVNDMAIGQTQFLNYTIRNNLRAQALPIKSITVINDLNGQVIPTATINSNCGSILYAGASCSITVTLNQTQAAVIKGHLSINYDGRTPLISPIALSVRAAKYTILIYIVGSDLESRDNAGTFNINQMMKVGSTKNINVVIETGGANKPGWFTVQRKLVLPGSVLLVSDLGVISMGAASTIKDFMVWGVNRYPADKYIVIFWDHGGGVNGGFGSSEVLPPPTATPINQLVAAVKGAYNSTGKKFEIIGFDTCLLANTEFISGIYPYTNYFVGSEDLEPGSGWQYDTFLNFINKNPSANGLSIGMEIVNGYTIQNNGDSTTLSVIDSAAIPNLVTAVDHFAVSLQPYANTTTDNWKVVAKGRFKAPDYSTSVWDNDSFDLVDLTKFAKLIPLQFPADTALRINSDALVSAVKNAVKYFKNSANRADSLGIQIYFPSILAQYETNYPNQTILNGSSFFTTNYTNLVKSYYDFYNANTANLIATLSNLAVAAGVYTATVSNDYNELFAAVGNDTCQNVFNSTGVNIPNIPCYSSIQYAGITSASGGGNTWNISFDNNTLGNSWPLLNGEPVLFLAELVPNMPNEYIYLIPVKSIKLNSDGYLQFVFNNGQYEVAGFQNKVGSTNTAGKLSEVRNGDTFYLRTYALNGTWSLLRTDTIVTAPFTVDFGAVPSPAFNAFRFLVGDLTGALNITPNSVLY